MSVFPWRQPLSFHASQSILGNQYFMVIVSMEIATRIILFFHRKSNKKTIWGGRVGCAAVKHSELWGFEDKNSKFGWDSPSFWEVSQGMGIRDKGMSQT